MMMNQLVVIFLGIPLAICFIVMVAYGLQQWLGVHQFSSKALPVAQEKHQPQFPELSERLRQNSGSDFPSFAIETRLSIPGSDDSIVMLDYGEVAQNVLRCHPDGSIVWFAEVAETFGDRYTHVVWDKENLRADSWSGFSVILDIDTGRILSSEFVK